MTCEFPNPGEGKCGVADWHLDDTIYRVLNIERYEKHQTTYKHRESIRIVLLRSNILTKEIYKYQTPFYKKRETLDKEIGTVLP